MGISTLLPRGKPKVNGLGLGKHEAVQVANKLIELANAAGRHLTPLQVIKLTYFCHAWMLGLHGRPLVSDRVEAWQYGPVFYGVYRALRQYGDSAAKPIPRVKEVDFDDIELDLIEQVSEKYGKWTVNELIRSTHAPGTPWHQVWGGLFGPTKHIPDEKIRDYYRALADEARKQTEVAGGIDGG